MPAVPCNTHVDGLVVGVAGVAGGCKPWEGMFSLPCSLARLLSAVFSLSLALGPWPRH
jgi:hypothetical protein